MHQRLPDRLLSLQGLLLRVLVFLTPEVPHLLIQMIGKRGPLQAGIVTGRLGQIGGHGRLPSFALLGAGRLHSHRLFHVWHFWIY